MKLVIREIERKDLRVIPGGGQPQEPEYDSEAFGPDLQAIKNAINEAMDFLKLQPPDVEGAIQKLEQLKEKL